MTDIADLIPVLTELSVDNRGLLTRLDAILTTGKPGAGVGAVGAIAIDMTAKIVYGPKASSGADPWGDGDGFLAGEDGREIELRVTATHVQQRYVGGAEWANLLALADLVGENGWSPVEGIEVDGARRVKVITDWVGGTGTKPPTGQYLGPGGWVETAAEATDVRGPGGAPGDGSGDMLAANNLSELTNLTTARSNLGVYSTSQVDTALAGKAATGDVTALDTRLDDVETALGGKASAASVAAVADDVAALDGRVDALEASGGGGGGALAGVTDWALEALMTSAAAVAVSKPWGFADPLASSSLLDLATSTGEQFTTGYVDNFTTPSLSVQGTPTGAANLSSGSSTAVRPSGTEAAGDVGIVLFYIRPTTTTTPIDLTGVTWRGASMTQVGSPATSTNGARLYVYRYTITGSESGSGGVLASWSGGIEARSAINAYRVRGANPVITAAFATGVNPPNLTGLASGKTNLFLAAVGGSSGTDSNAEAPADYTDVVNAANFSGATSIVSARRLVAATSNDPGTFTNAPSGTNLTLACTVGIEVGVGVTSEMSLVWNAFTTPGVPSAVAVWVEVEAVTGTITPNTNLFVDFSRDGGETYSTAVLKARGNPVGGVQALCDWSLSLASQPSDNDCRFRIRTDDDAGIRVHKAGALAG